MGRVGSYSGRRPKLADDYVYDSEEPGEEGISKHQGVPRSSSAPPVRPRPNSTSRLKRAAGNKQLIPPRGQAQLPLGWPLQELLPQQQHLQIAQQLKQEQLQQQYCMNGQGLVGPHLQLPPLGGAQLQGLQHMEGSWNSLLPQALLSQLPSIPLGAGTGQSSLPSTLQLPSSTLQLPSSNLQLPLAVEPLHVPAVSPAAAAAPSLQQLLQLLPKTGPPALPLGPLGVANGNGHMAGTMQAPLLAQPLVLSPAALQALLGSIAVQSLPAQAAGSLPPAVAIKPEAAQGPGV